MTEWMQQNRNITGGENDMSQFLQDIRRFPLLSAEEERFLARRCASGDEEAIRQMVNSNLRLVVSVAREYAGRGVPLLDLIQEGSIGLLSAARKYDYTMGTRFSTYAAKWIRQGVTRCLINHGGLIRVPAYTAEQIQRVKQAVGTFLRDQGREPEIHELAQMLGMPEDKVRQLRRLEPEVSSLDVPVGEGEEDSLETVLEDVCSPQPYEELVRLELETSLNQLMSGLNPRQRRILRLHFGMEDGRCHSLEEISREMNISKERVRQIEHRAMEKLQKDGSGLGLEGFLND